MAERLTKKERLFALFDQGYAVNSDEVKAVKLKHQVRWNYHRAWKEARKATGLQKAKPQGNLGEKEPEGGLKMVKPQVPPPPPPVVVEEVEPRDEEPRGEEGKPKDEIIPPTGEDGGKPKTKAGDGKKVMPPGMVAGQGLTFAITISVKTLMLYQIAASQQEEELTLGDFIDACVEDTYRGRGLDLGLVKFGGKDNGG